MNESNVPMKQESRGLNYADPKIINTIKATVAQNATDTELAMFLQFCQSTGLNPFKKELWFVKASGRVQMMTGINGFFAIANSTPEFDGHESGLIDAKGNYVTAAYPGEFIGAWCKVYRKDRRIPTEGVAMLSEYDKKQSTWNSMKRVMITKCAESVALRKAFPQQLNGLYTAEEMPLEFSNLELENAPKTPRKGGLSEAQINDHAQNDFAQRMADNADDAHGSYIDPEYPDEGDAFAYQFQGPPSDDTKRMLKDHGHKWNPTTRQWWGGTLIPELEQFRVSL